MQQISKVFFSKNVGIYRARLHPAAGQTQETDPQPQQDYTAQIDALRGDNQQAAELFAKIIEAQNEQSQTLAALLSRLEALEAQPANPPRAEQTGEAGSVGW